MWKVRWSDHHHVLDPWYVNSKQHPRRLKRKSECESGEVCGKKSNLRSDVFSEEGSGLLVDAGDNQDGRSVSKFTLDNLVQSGVKLDDRRQIAYYWY